MVKKNSFYNWGLVQLFFVMLTCLVTYWLGSSKTIYVYSDWTFHASRVEEIYQNLKAGSWLTFIAAHTFQQSGAASFLFYPTIFFYPWALLRFLVSPVSAFYIWYALVTFMTLSISYWVMGRYSNNGWRAFVFALIYTFNPYRLYLGTAVFGEFIAATFIPIVFLGAFEVLWRNEKKWPILAIGGALVAMSHLLSVFLSIQFLIILMVVKILVGRKIELQRLMALAKSACLALGLVLFEVVPFITDYVGHHIFSAYSGIGILMTWKQFLTASFTNNLVWGIGTCLIATLFLGWLLISTKYDLAVYVLAWGATIMATDLFPWRLFSHTPLGTVQLTFRYLMYAALFLSVLFSKIGLVIECKLKNAPLRKNKIIVAITLSGLVVSYFVSSMGTLIKNDVPILNAPSKLSQLVAPVRIDSKNYQNLFQYIMYYGEFDYYPMASRGTAEATGFSVNSESIINHKLFINNKAKQLYPQIDPNQISYKIRLDRHSIVDVPIVAYNNTIVKVNGKNSKFKISNRGTPMVSLPVGKYTIAVSYRPPFSYYLGIITSLCTWSIFILRTLISVIRKRKNNVNDFYLVNK